MEAAKAQASLETVVATLARELPGMAPKDACTRLAWLRQQAAVEGFAPAAMLADSLASAITREGRDIVLAPWLEALSVAAAYGSDDPEAGTVLLATVGVRFAG